MAGVTTDQTLSNLKATRTDIGILSDKTNVNAPYYKRIYGEIQNLICSKKLLEMFSKILIQKNQENLKLMKIMNSFRNSGKIY